MGSGSETGVGSGKRRDADLDVAGKQQRQELVRWRMLGVAGELLHSGAVEEVELEHLGAADEIGRGGCRGTLWHTTPVLNGGGEATGHHALTS